MTLLEQEDGPEHQLANVLYPHVPADRRGYLDVGSGHEIYFELFGRKGGIPVVVLHGGPGSGSSPTGRRFFDPAYFRVITFDQRGTGKSRPTGSLEANTTEHLVADIDALRAHLGYSCWLVSGGSWGATLALAYGITHPSRCRGFLLRSVALGQESDFHWWVNGMANFFPESWHRFADHVCEQEQDDLLAAYGRRLASGDEAISGPAALEWHRYESACSSLLPKKSEKLENTTLARLIDMARIESHYFLNNAFLADNWILRNKKEINHLPAAIVHGRYDVICPPKCAYDLADAWPRAKLRIVDASGHQPTDILLAKAFREETDAARGWYNSSSFVRDA